MRAYGTPPFATGPTSGSPLHGCGLTLGADMRAALADAEADDGRSAAAAGLAGAAVDREVSLHAAAGIDPVDGGSVQPDGEAEYSADGPVETDHLGIGNGVRSCQRMEASGGERFVGVDVAEAGDERLVKEEGFELSLALMQDTPQSTGGEGRPEGFEPEAGGRGREIACVGDGPELTRVAEQTLASVVQLPDGSNVSRCAVGLVGPFEATAHAEVQEQMGIVLQVEDEELATSLYAGDEAVGELAFDAGRAGGDVPPPGGRETAYSAAHELWPAGADDGFNLGEFGHTWIVAGVEGNSG